MVDNNGAVPPPMLIVPPAASLLSLAVVAAAAVHLRDIAQHLPLLSSPPLGLSTTLGLMR